MVYIDVHLELWNYHEQRLDFCKCVILSSGRICLELELSEMVVLLATCIGTRVGHCTRRECILPVHNGVLTVQLEKK